MGSPQSGDRIRFTAATPEGSVTHEGILLAPATSGHMTVKLDNGYNVTFAETEVTALSTISTPNLSGENVITTLTENPDLPEIWIIHTG